MKHKYAFIDEGIECMNHEFGFMDRVNTYVVTQAIVRVTII